MPSGNAVARVDTQWFDHARRDTVLDQDVLLVPPEEMVWSKAFIMERERFDGADVAHVLRACADELDWSRLVRRFGDHFRVLLSHLILFGIIYPGEKSKIPGPVMVHLLDRLRREVAIRQRDAEGRRHRDGERRRVVVGIEERDPQRIAYRRLTRRLQHRDGRVRLTRDRKERQPRRP